MILCDVSIIDLSKTGLQNPGNIPCSRHKRVNCIPCFLSGNSLLTVYNDTKNNLKWGLRKPYQVFTGSPPTHNIVDKYKSTSYRSKVSVPRRISQNHALSSSTYLYCKYRGVPPYIVILLLLWTNPGFWGRAYHALALREGWVNMPPESWIDPLLLQVQKIRLWRAIQLSSRGPVTVNPLFLSIRIKCL